MTVWFSAYTWTVLAAVFYLGGAAVNMASVVKFRTSPRRWIRASSAVFGAVIGGHWLALVIFPDIDRAFWSEGLTPWSTFAGVMGVGCLGAIHDFAIAHRIRRER